MITYFYKFIAHLTLILSSFLLSFHAAVAQDYPNTPVGVVQKYFDAIAANDTNTYLDTVAPEDRKLPGIPFMRQLVQGLLSYYGFGGMDAAKISISFINLTFQETSNDGTVAKILVTGSMRDLNLGIESPLNTEISTMKLNGTWYVKLYAFGNQLPTVTTNSTYPRDAIAPQTPEQIAAATTFEQYMAQNDTQYRAAQYNTIQSTTTSAIVEIKMELIDANTGIWVEHSTTLPMKLLAGMWRADTSKITIGITEQGQALLNTQAAAKAQATQVAADYVGYGYAQMLGGTLIYLLDDNKTVEGRRSNGSLFQIKSENSLLIHIVELMPNGEGFYSIEAYENSWTLFVYRYTLQSSRTKPVRIKRIENDGTRSLTAIAASPDNTKLAIAFGDGIYVISTIDGKSLAHASILGNGATGLAWSTDSTTLYLHTATTISEWRPETEKQDQKVDEITIPYASDTNYVQDLALSPNSLDLFLGGHTFRVFNISDKTQFDLSNGKFLVACNPVYTADGSQIITLIDGNWINKFDLTTGNWTPVIQLPIQDTTQSKCPIFDWIPENSVANVGVSAITTPTSLPPPTITPTATPSPTITPTQSPTPPPLPTITIGPTLATSQVRIIWVVRPGDPLNEQIDLQNSGDTITIKGWSISDTQGNKYVFSDSYLPSNGNLTLFTRKGQDTPNAVFWNRDIPVFEPGDTAILLDGNNNVVSTYTIPNQ